ARYARATSSAKTTPSAPSSQPPLGTLSECDPASRATRAEGERPNTLPIPSIVALSPASAIRSRSHSRAATSASVKAVRLTPVPAFPNWASERRSASARSSSSPSITSLRLFSFGELVRLTIAKHCISNTELIFFCLGVRQVSAVDLREKGGACSPLRSPREETHENDHSARGRRGGDSIFRRRCAGGKPGGDARPAAA